MYENVRSELECDEVNAETNSLFCTAAIDLLLRYVQYLPFWSGLLLGD